MVVENELNCVLISKLPEGKKSRFRVKLSPVNFCQDKEH